MPFCFATKDVLSTFQFPFGKRTWQGKCPFSIGTTWSTTHDYTYIGIFIAMEPRVFDTLDVGKLGELRSWSVAVALASLFLFFNSRCCGWYLTLIFHGTLSLFFIFFQ